MGTGVVTGFPLGGEGGIFRNKDFENRNKKSRAKRIYIFFIAFSVVFFIVSPNSDFLTAKME